MRLLALTLGLVLLCGCGKGPTTPIQMGLWEVTTRRVAACSPEVAAQIRKHGLSQERGSEYINCSGEPNDPTTTVKAHACFTESTWKQKKERIATATAPERCVYSKPFSEDAHGMSSTLECSGAGMTLTTASSAAWPDHEHMHWIMQSTVIFETSRATALLKSNSIVVSLDPTVARCVQEKGSSSNTEAAMAD